MKRIFVIMLALCLVCLCGCGAAEPPEAEKAPLETLIPIEEAPAETPASAAEAPAPGDASALTAILEEIRERSRPGTAGSSLTALELGAGLLDWAMQTELDEAQIRAAVEDFLAPMKEIERAGYALQMGSVSGAVGRLLGEDAEALLDDVGGTEGTLWPWENAPREKLDALFDAAGVNELVNDPNR